MKSILNENKWYFGILFIIFVTSIFSSLILYFATHFTKVITIKDKHQYFASRRTKYMVVGKDDTIYNLANVWWKGDFNKSDDWVQLEKGKSYKVKGYGIRLPIITMYKNIYAFEKV
jgi:hypothetical protein